MRGFKIEEVVRLGGLMNKSDGTWVTWVVEAPAA